MDNSQNKSNASKNLMERVARGDKHAFETLIHLHHQPVMNFIYRFMGDLAEAEDLTQEVFLRAWKSAGTYKPDAKLTTWIFRIATNLCINKQRAIRIRRWFSVSEPYQQEQQSDEPSIIDVGTIKTTPEDYLIQSELSQHVRKALDALPTRQRLAVVLKIYDGLSYHEISQILGCSVSAVDSLLIRAKKNLRKKLIQKK